MSEKQYRDKIATIKKQQGTEEKVMAKARSAAAKHRVGAARELAKITPRASESMARAHRRNADSAERKAVAEDGKRNDSDQVGAPRQGSRDRSNQPRPGGTGVGSTRGE